MHTCWWKPIFMKLLWKSIHIEFSAVCVVFQQCRLHLMLDILRIFRCPNQKWNTKFTELKICGCRTWNVKLQSNNALRNNKDSKLLKPVWFNSHSCFYFNLSSLFYQCCSEDVGQNCRPDSQVPKCFLWLLHSRQIHRGNLQYMDCDCIIYSF